MPRLTESSGARAANGRPFVHDEPKSPRPRRLADVVKRQWWVVALVTFLAVGAAIVVTGLQTPKYRAEMKLVVGQAGGDVQPVIGSQSLTQTMTTLLESEVVASSVIRRLGLDMTPEEIDKKLKVVVQPGSSVLEVAYTADTPEKARTILDEFGRSFTAEVDRKLGVRAGSFGGGSTTPILFATIFNAAHADPKAISPQRASTAMTAGVVGLVVGLVLAFVRERLDDRIRTRDEAEAAFGAPVIASLAGGRGRSTHRAAMVDDAVQTLALNFELMRNGRSEHGLGSVSLVTSTQRGEGAVAVVASLAIALAQTGSDVICVDCDPQEADLRSHLDFAGGSAGGGAPADPSAPDIADGSVDELLQQLDLTAHTRDGMRAGRLRVLTLEGWQAALATMARGDRGAALVQALREQADYVIILGSPLAAGDPSRLALLSDSVVVVARAGQTVRPRAESAGAMLQRLGLNDIGVVLTSARADGA